MNSDVEALYMESLNRLTELYASRVAVGLQRRIPTAVWTVFCGLTFCGMAAVRYQTGIAGSRRSWARTLLAISFSMVVSLITALDHPNGFFKVSQGPLMNLHDSMDSVNARE